jgi:hypothetical protein
MSTCFTAETTVVLWGGICSKSCQESNTSGVLGPVQSLFYMTLYWSFAKVAHPTKIGTWHSMWIEQNVEFYLKHF